MTDTRYCCNVCNWKSARPKEVGDICSCCGAEHGVDDDWHYRSAWLKKGAPWFRPDEKPDGWDLRQQLHGRSQT